MRGAITRAGPKGSSAMQVQSQSGIWNPHPPNPSLRSNASSRRLSRPPSRPSYFARPAGGHDMSPPKRGLGHLGTTARTCRANFLAANAGKSRPQTDQVSDGVRRCFMEAVGFSSRRPGSEGCLRGADQPCAAEELLILSDRKDLPLPSSHGLASGY